MIKLIKNLSIKRKIITIILLVSFLVLSAGFLLFMTWDINRLKDETQSNLILNTKLIADYCVVPLTFLDDKLATESLSRLKILESVEAGYLFDDKKTLFAKYPENLKEIYTQEISDNPGVEFKGGYFYIHEPVYFKEKILGHILIKANSNMLEKRKQNIILTVFLLIFALVIISYVLAARMQKIISRPVLDLNKHFKRISVTQDYSKRILKENNDEIGDLFDGFNELINKIQVREKERNQAEEALKESKSMLNTILDTVPLSIFWKDKNSVYLGCNKTFANIAGIKNPDSITGKTDYDMPWTHEEAETFRSDDREVIRNKTPRYHIIEPLKTADNKDIWIDTSIIPIIDSNGDRSLILGVFEDITERKLIEEALQKSERRYKLLLESITDYTYSVEIKNGRPISTIHGAGCEKVTGYLPSDYLNNPDLWLKMVHPDDQNIVEHHADPLYTGKNVPPIEHRIIHKNGSVIWVRNTYVLKHSEDGKVIGYDGLISDITERKLAEEEIRNLNAELEDRVMKRTSQLEAANKELEAFSYSVSHDLRAPLRHTSGYVELLIKRCKSDLSEKGKHYLENISDSVHQMGNLIDDLLQFSRTGRTEMRQSDSDMNEILNEVLTSLNREKPNQNIEWIINKLPHVFCDYSMLRLVWMNLLSNAVKFSRKKEKPRIEIGVEEKDKEFIFHVRDNGVGFDMQYAQKLFGVFQRLHSNEEFEGTGIGLANVRRIITRHGGFTWAESELDKGAIFYFSLPK